MKIQIICVGKLKEGYLRELMDTYAKEIQKKYSFEVIELADEQTPDHAGEKENMKIKELEGKRILAKIPEESLIVALCIEGTPLSSESFVRKWTQWKRQSIPCVTFIIGGSLGLSKQVVSRSNLKLSFSQMTFPHQLMRVILTEQLSRL